MTVRPIVCAGQPGRCGTRHARSRASTTRSRTLVQDMIETMRDAPASGLAAPQVGVPLQVAVVVRREGRVHVLVNPGDCHCRGRARPGRGLLPFLHWGLTRREGHRQGLDTHGEEIRISAAEGLLGQALQHEIDHLNGMVYVDRLDSLTSFSAPPGAARPPLDRRAP